jgi:hypothetical protein
MLALDAENGRIETGRSGPTEQNRRKHAGENEDREREPPCEAPLPLFPVAIPSRSLVRLHARFPSCDHPAAAASAVPVDGRHGWPRSPP